MILYDVFVKMNLSCDVIVVSHISHRVIVFERAHVNKRSPDWKTAQETSHRMIVVFKQRQLIC